MGCTRAGPTPSQIPMCQVTSDVVRLGSLAIVPGSRATLVRREGAGPQRGYTRPGTGSLHPVAIRAAVEATRLLKPLVQRVANPHVSQLGRKGNKLASLGLVR